MSSAERSSLLQIAFAATTLTCCTWSSAVQILGRSDINNIVRLQLARMAPGTSDIKIHQDMGGYAIKGHRIHVPITTHPLVSFSLCPDGDANAAALVQGLAAAAAAGGFRRKAAPLSGRRLTQVQSASLAAKHVPAKQPQQQRRQRQLQEAAVGSPDAEATKPGRGPAQQSEQQTPRPAELLPVEASHGYYTGEEHSEMPAVADDPQAVTVSRQPKQVPEPALQQQQQDAVLSKQQIPLTNLAGAAANADIGQWQQQQHRGQSELLKHTHQRPCMQLHTPEGLVFELNNRVPHKVNNPKDSDTTRIHLVIDVFESSRVRTPLVAGSVCEYGSLPVNALSQLQDMLAQSADVDFITNEIRALVAAPGMTCVGPDGRRVHLLRKAHPGVVEAAVMKEEEELVQQLLGQLQELVAQRRKAASEATLNSVH
jgi:hypothetical protein